MPGSRAPRPVVRDGRESVLPRRCGGAPRQRGHTRSRPHTRVSNRLQPRGRGIRRRSAVVLQAPWSSRFLPLLEHGHAVLAAEAEAVHDDVADRQLAGFPWHIVEVTLGIWRELVDGWRDA